MTSSIHSFVRKTTFGLVVALALLVGSAAPSSVRAAAPPSGLSAAPVFADEGLSFSKFIKGFNNRARVVQLCVVCMLLALFIIIKKLDGDGSPHTH